MATTTNAFHARRLASQHVIDKGYRSGLATSGSGAVVEDKGYRTGLKEVGRGSIGKAPKRPTRRR